MILREAQFATLDNIRGATRRCLTLEVTSTTGAGNKKVLIHNLSRTGLLIETAADLAVGETLVVELPRTGPRNATVVWVSQTLFGCVFDKPIGKASVSAALLNAPWGKAMAQELPHAAIPEQSSLDLPGTDSPLVGLSLRARASSIVVLTLLLWLGLIAIGLEFL